MPSYFDYFGDFSRTLALLLPWGDVVAYGRRRLSHPHRSDRKKKAGKAKAQRRARNKRRRKRQKGVKA